jgi:capsid protein
MPALTTASRWLSGFLGYSAGVAVNPYPGSRVDEQYPARPHLALDQKDLLNRMQHRELLNSSRHIYNAFPAVSGAINDIANHAVGQSWQPQYKGRFADFGDLAEDWLREYSKICDVRGHPYTLTTDMHVGAVTLCRDGEFFLHLTSNEAGYPLVQFIESHRIGSRATISDGVIQGGPFAGLIQKNGIAYNAYSRPVGYHFLGDAPELDQWIPAERMLHVFDPKWFSQGRGISPLVYGILDWLDVQGWRQNEKIAQVMLSSIAMTEANEEGAPDTLQARMARAAAAAAGTEQAAKPRKVVESFNAGMVRFLKLNGSNLKAFETGRPSPNQANFEERVLRGCFRALGWTYEQALDSRGQGGANVRRDVAQNQKSVEHMQEILMAPWRRVLIYALAAGSALDLLIDDEGNRFALVPDWYKWRPQLPQKMTVDHGRDRRVDIEEIRTGARTMIQDIRDRGGDEDAHLDEQIKFYKLKQAKADQAQIPREDWVECFGSLLINPSAQPATEEGDEETTPPAPARNQPDEQ